MANKSKSIHVGVVKRDDIPVDIHVYQEYRRNVRIALLKTKVNLRIPLLVSETEKEKYINWALDWTRKRIKKNLLNFPQPERIYAHGDQLQILDDHWLIHISYDVMRDSAFGKIVGNRLDIRISPNQSDNSIQESVRYIVRNLLCKYYRSFMIHRVMEINKRWFGQDISGIRLKYNTSNWGSCSVNKNLNFSLRLLFAPKEVIDYVIQHELAHLIEMNHSAKFWNILEKIDPDYQTKEKWLKEHSYTAFV
jgi:predicted metal-dependent hydrolase